MSYWDTAWALCECVADAVPGLPAYTFPACPVGLNGAPFDEAEPPGAVVNRWHVVFGAPGWPGPFGLVLADAATGIAMTMPAATSTAPTRFISTSLSGGRE